MIRKYTNEDISGKELEKVINPFYDNYHEYIITYVMPEVIAFYIAVLIVEMLCGKQLFINIIILLKILLLFVMMMMIMIR